MKFLLVFNLLAFSSTVYCQLSDKQIHDLKSGKFENDSSYVYWLPYENNKSFLLIQAANSSLSHKNELSFDFKMKIGSKICAAREGIVESVRSDSDNGGLKESNLSEGNYIIVSHNDGSRAKYWHLMKDGVMVKQGQSITKGQIIGRSGNTGYSAFPHLHFQIVDKSGKQILPRFLTKRGIRYIRPGRRHQSVHPGTL